MSRDDLVSSWIPPKIFLLCVQLQGGRGAGGPEGTDSLQNQAVQRFSCLTRVPGVYPWPVGHFHTWNVTTLIGKELIFRLSEKISQTPMFLRNWGYHHFLSLHNNQISVKIFNVIGAIYSQYIHSWMILGLVMPHPKKYLILPTSFINYKTAKSDYCMNRQFAIYCPAYETRSLWQS